MGDLLDSMEPMKPLRRGDVVEGVVMRADPDGVFVNIGAKVEGVVPPGEMRTLETDDINVGDDILTFVIRPETADQGAVLSIDRALGEQGWRVLEQKMESSEGVEGTILGFNRGGAIVDVDGIQGFVPMSQLVSVSRNRIRETYEAADAEQAKAQRDKAEALQVEAPQAEAPQAEAPQGEAPKAEAPQAEAAASPQAQDPLEEIGKVLQLKVLEVNRSRNRAIFSERQAIQEARNEQKARLISELTEGEVRRGKVTGISSFGAFVDLGGADGLIHISELSWTTVRTPEEVVQVGDELDVFVLRVDAVNRKIALSLRRLQPEPWVTINEHFQVGDIVDATVTKLTNFGAFARVEGSVEGLIHISELSSRIVNHPKEVVHEGDALKVKVLRIEPERRRIGLSLRQAEEEGVFSVRAEEGLAVEEEAEAEAEVTTVDEVIEQKNLTAEDTVEAEAELVVGDEVAVEEEAEAETEADVEEETEADEVVTAEDNVEAAADEADVETEAVEATPEEVEEVEAEEDGEKEKEEGKEE